MYDEASDGVTVELIGFARLNYARLNSHHLATALGQCVDVEPKGERPQNVDASGCDGVTHLY